MHPVTGTSLLEEPERFVPGTPTAISHCDDVGFVGKDIFEIGHVLARQPDHQTVGIGGICIGLLTANVAKSVDPVGESVIFVAVAGNTNNNRI